jgi:hypothetical protein
MQCRNKKYKDHVLVFEIAEALFVYALAQANLGGVLADSQGVLLVCFVTLSSQTPVAYAESGKALRVAAGVFEYIAQNVLSKWVGMPTKHPIEAELGLSSCFMSLCLAQAQQVAIAKAIAGGRVPRTLLMKLYMGCVQLYGRAAGGLRLLDREQFERVSPRVREVGGEQSRAQLSQTAPQQTAHNRFTATTHICSCSRFFKQHTMASTNSTQWPPSNLIHSKASSSITFEAGANGAAH